jgi:putative transposase
MVTDAIARAVEARGGRSRGTVLHSDRGGEFTAHLTARACFRHGLRRSMGATEMLGQQPGGVVLVDVQT